MAPGLVYERILLPVDGSEHAERATEHAIELAKRYEAELTVCFVVRTGTPYGGIEGPGLEVAGYAGTLASEGEKLVEATARRAREAGVEEVDTVIERSSNVGEGILAAIERTGSDLVVMGTHGRTGLDRFLVGSVAETVVRGASVPVMTVGAPGESGDESEGDGASA